MLKQISKKGLVVGGFLVAVVVAVFFWFGRQKAELPAAFASGNGRIEAIEYDIATKQPGRIAKVLAREGDMVAPEQILAQMDTAELEADLRQAQAEIRMAREDRKQAEATVDQRESEIKQARAAVSQRRSDIKTAQAGVSQRNSELALAEKEFVRAQELVNKDFIARNEFDQAYTKKETAQAALLQEQARQRAVEAALTLEEARLQSAEALFKGAQIQVSQRQAAIEADEAKVQKLKSILADAVLKSPIQGRVLYRLAEPGEVLPAGGKVLTVIELTDVYMTIFLPTSLAGRLSIGAEARIIVDAVPQYVIPATVSFVAPRSQFTPKEVETKTEREKLMFRIKVKIDPELLRKHVQQVKTGLPGVAYVRLDATTAWPEHLKVKLPP